jgi:hypothetical protein
MPRRRTAAPAAADTAQPAYTRAQELRGNFSLLALAASALVFYAWRFLTDYPPAAAVSLLGIPGVRVSHLKLVVDLVVSWLALALVFSLRDLPRFIANFPRLFRVLPGKDWRDFFSAATATVLSLALLAAVLCVFWFNGRVELTTVSPEYEVLVKADAGPDQPEPLLVRDPESGEAVMVSEARVARGRPVEVLLRGRTRPLLLIRDRYGLSTLEALRLRRRGLCFAAEPVEARVPNPDKTWLDYFATRRASVGIDRSCARLRLKDDLRFADRFNFEILDQQGNVLRREFLFPGSGERCTGAPDVLPAEVGAFLEEICGRREVLAQWSQGRSRTEAGEHFVFHDLPGHRLKIRFTIWSFFAKGEKQPLIRTREAVRVVAMQRPEPPPTPPVTPPS